MAKLTTDETAALESGLETVLKNLDWASFNIRRRERGSAYGYLELARDNLNQILKQAPFPPGPCACQERDTSDD